MSDGTAGMATEVDIYDMPSRDDLRPYLGHEGAWLMRHPMVPWAGGTALPFVPTAPRDYPATAAITASGALTKTLAFAAGGAIAYYGIRALRRFTERHVR